MYEVEQKFRIADLPGVESRLSQLGGIAEPAETQVDCYYAHPVRDFAQTDEALRLRRVGDANWVTYKGPKLDATTKTRREIEVPLEAGERAAADFASLLEAVGFRVVAEVYKQRRHMTVRWRDRLVAVALDRVDHVGDFVELELASDAAGLDAAREAIGSLATELGLVDSERRSYLELLLGER